MKWSSHVESGAEGLNYFYCTSYLQQIEGELRPAKLPSSETGKPVSIKLHPTQPSSQALKPGSQFQSSSIPPSQAPKL
jgi:hypothetical protein